MNPVRLRRGDTIGVISPSTPVTTDTQQQFEDGIAFLQEMGFFIKPGKHVHSKTLGYAASPQEKAADINAMFDDPDVRAIICSQGGATANAALTLLDYDLIRRNPKIFLGISDITVLLNAIHQQTGLVTFHGNDVMWGFGRDPGLYDRQEFEAVLLQGRVGAIPPNGPRTTIREGVAEGKCMGGNLSCLMKLAGTPYQPDFRDSVLFLEAMHIAPETCDFVFHQMLQMGVFDAVRGVVIGYIDSLQTNPQPGGQMEDILARVSADYAFPILKVNDFGHNCPNTVLPIGARVRVDADYQTIEILEGYLD